MLLNIAESSAHVDQKSQQEPPPQQRQHTRYHSSISDVLYTPLSEYTLLEKVGQGSFGVVRRARRRSTGEDVAIKPLVRVCPPARPTHLCLPLYASFCLWYA